MLAVDGRSNNGKTTLAARFVPAGCPLLIIEGDGAGRREVAHLIDTLIWVQADERETERRTAARKLKPGY